MNKPGYTTEHIIRDIAIPMNWRPAVNRILRSIGRRRKQGHADKHREARKMSCGPHGSKIHGHHYRMLGLLPHHVNERHHAASFFTIRLIDDSST